MNRAWLNWTLGSIFALYLFVKYTDTGKAIMQKISDAGLTMIAEFEGFSEQAYNDPPGSSKWSIGFGHQIQPGEPYMTENITVEKGRQLLAIDTANAQAIVKSTITRPLTTKQFDALTSFVFNIGGGAFKNGTVPQKINAGDFKGAAETMRKYVNAGGVVNQALVKRREEEASTFA